MAPVVIMLSTIFCAVPAFMRVEPETDLGTDFGNDGDIRGCLQGRAVIAGDGGGVRAACTRIGDGSDNVGGAAGSRKPDHDVFAGGAAAGDVPLAKFFGVFVDFDGGGQSLRTAGHDVLHLAGSGRVSRRALRGIQGCNSAAGTGANIDQSAAIAEAACNLVDDLCDLRDCLLDRGCNLRIFVIDNAGDFECRFGVKPLRSLILALGGQVL